MKSETIKVLLIEDDEDDYILTRELFSEIKGGFDLEWVSTYEEGLQEARRCEHDVILVDYRLGEQNGVDLIREAQKNGCRTPMIMLTGQTDRDLDIEAMHAGAADYLIKNETRAALLERTLRFIIERRHIEEDLRRSEEAYRLLAQQQSTILNALPANIALVDSTGQIIAVNEGWKKFALAHDETEIHGGIGRHYLEACKPWPESSTSHAALTTAGFHDILKGGLGQFEMEYLCHCHTAPEPRWFRMLARPFSEHGIGGAVIMHIDITDHAMAGETLRASESRYHRLFDTAHDGILILDHATRKITDANPFMVELLGYSRDELVGRELWEIGLAKDEAASIAAFQTLQEIGYIRYDDLPLETKDGKRCEVEIISNGYTENGHLVMQCNIRNITERKLAEEERERLLARTQAAQLIAERANQLKDEFLATLSHELRTPLTAIVGWAEMLGSLHLDAVASIRAIEVIRRNARMQVQMVDDLLDVSRIITGKLRLSVQPVDLSALISAAVDGLRPAAEAKEIIIQLQLDGPAGQVLGDPERLQQVAWNLVSNAIKFTPQGGRVLVSLERHASQVEVIVSDSGQGIAPEFLPHVFDRFRQADATSTRVHGGLGLGLAIVRQLVELHGGTVRVDSVGVGQGSTFIVNLPLAVVSDARNDLESVSPQAVTSPEFISALPLDGLRVLVVDDEADTREVLQVILESSHAYVSTVSSADAALAAIKAEAFDVLISDIGMPEEDGYTLIAKVRALGEERGRLPAAALTAYAGEEDRLRALQSGYQIHVPKPVNPSELVTAIAHLAGRTGAG